MSEKSILLRLHQHRCWVNQRLVSVSRELTPEELRQAFPIGQGSLWRTLLHLYAAEYVWLETLQGNETPCAPGDVATQLPGNQAGDKPIATLDELCQLWRELDHRWQAYLQSLQPEQLEQWVYKVKSGSPTPQRSATRVVDVLLHLCTHSQYTAAQFNNMLRQLNHTAIPDLMLITMARQENSFQS